MKTLRWLFMLGAVVVPVLLCSCARITTERYAYINPNENSVYLYISGYYLCPVSPHGSFPPWSDDVWVKLNPGTTLPKTGRKEYIARTDFSTRFNKVQSGTMVLDMSNLTVTVRFKYIPDYRWCLVQGTFRPKDYEVFPETFGDANTNK